MAVNNPTTNFGWDLPTVGGSADAWGTILNTLFGEDGGSGTKGIDEVIQDVADAAADASNLTSGTLADARVAESNVTQHQAALAIAGSQITSEIAVANIPDLSAAKITSGTLADARLSSNVPLLDASNTFTSFQTVERAGASGTATVSRVTGDAVARFIKRIDGQMQWGDGTNTRDTNLYRDAANVLKTDDKFVAGNGLRVAAAGDNWIECDVDTAGVTLVGGTGGVTSGANLLVQGPSHASAPSVGRGRVSSTEIFRWDSAGLRVSIDGSAGTPALGFESDKDTGMFLESVGNLGFAAGGAEIARVLSSGIQLAATKALRAPSTGDVEPVLVCETSGHTSNHDPTTDAPAEWIRATVGGIEVAIPCYGPLVG